MRDIRDTLQWYVQMGVDEVISEEPLHRIQKEKALSLSRISKMASTSGESRQVIAEPSFASPSTKGNPHATAVGAAKTSPMQDASVATDLPAQSNSAALSAPLIMPDEAQKMAKKLADDAADLEALHAAIREFKGLSICRTATNPVVGEGAKNPLVMIIGEAPGAEEDMQGRPFCGASGQMLDKMIACINLSRETNTYITNSIHWRPPGNRRPTPEEITCCKPFVEKHIALVKPALIILVGGTAVTAVLDAKQAKKGMSALRGEDYEYQNEYMSEAIPTTAIFHPSYLLRSPGKKQMVWRDLLEIEEKLVQRGLMEPVKMPLKA